MFIDHWYDDEDWSNITRGPKSPFLKGRYGSAGLGLMSIQSRGWNISHSDFVSPGSNGRHRLPPRIPRCRIDKWVEVVVLISQPCSSCCATRVDRYYTSLIWSALPHSRRLVPQRRAHAQGRKAARANFLANIGTRTRWTGCGTWRKCWLVSRIDDRWGVEDALVKLRGRVPSHPTHPIPSHPIPEEAGEGKEASSEAGYDHEEFEFHFISFPSISLWLKMFPTLSSDVPLTSLSFINGCPHSPFPICNCKKAGRKGIPGSWKSGEHGPPSHETT